MHTYRIRLANGLWVTLAMKRDVRVTVQKQYAKTFTDYMAAVRYMMASTLPYEIVID
jgi:hypothetical protein